MRMTLLSALGLSLGGVAVLGLATDARPADEAGFVRLTPEQIHWQDMPDAYGGQVANIAGDPNGHPGRSFEALLGALEALSQDVGPC